LRVGWVPFQQGGKQPLGVCALSWLSALPALPCRLICDGTVCRLCHPHGCVCCVCHSHIHLPCSALASVCRLCHPRTNLRHDNPTTPHPRQSNPFAPLCHLQVHQAACRRGALINAAAVARGGAAGAACAHGRSAGQLRPRTRCCGPGAHAHSR